jgi:hypothetical protein
MVCFPSSHTSALHTLTAVVGCYGSRPACLCLHSLHGTRHNPCAGQAAWHQPHPALLCKKALHWHGFCACDDALDTAVHALPSTHHGTRPALVATTMVATTLQQIDPAFGPCQTRNRSLWPCCKACCTSTPLRSLRPWHALQLRHTLQPPAHHCTRGFSQGSMSLCGHVHCCLEVFAPRFAPPLQWSGSRHWPAPQQNTPLRANATAAQHG